MKKNPVQFYKELPAAFKSSAWFTFCNFFQRGTAFITVPIFTRLLTTEQYGTYNVYLAWFDLFVLFTSLKIPYEGLHNGLIRYEEDKDRYVSSVAGLMTVLTTFGLIVYLVFRDVINSITGLSSFIMVLMFIELFFNPPLFLWTNWERFDFRYRWPVVVTILSTFLNPTIAIIAVLNTPYKAEARIMATVGVQGFFGLILYIYIFLRGKTFFHKEYWKFALGFNLPLIFYYLSQSLLSQSDRIMINYFNGTGKAGIYSVAFSAATLVQLAVSAINASLRPWIYKKLKAKSFSEVRSVTNSLLLLIAISTVAMIAFAPDLVALLATSDYHEAIWIMPPVAASVFFIFLYMVIAGIEMYYEEIRYISLVSIIASVANVVLNFVFIKLCGYMAAGWTTLVCYILLTIMHWYLMGKALRKHQVEEAVIDPKATLLICVSVIVLVFVMLGTYFLGYFRYVVLILIAAVLYIMRAKLMTALMSIRKR